MNFNKRIVMNIDDRPFHSSGYARVANGNRIGSVANISFDKRQQIEKNRQKVDSYRRSTVGNSYGVLRARQYVKPTTPVLCVKNSLQSNNAAAPARRAFSEPSGRRYDPYS